MHPGKLFVAALAAVSVAACDEPNDRNIAVGELASDRIELIAEVNEPILEIAVAEGDPVTAGQLILRQDDVRASAPEAVVRLLDQYGEAAQLLMGGTDLLVRKRDGALRPQVVIDVKHLPGMQDVSYDAQRGLRVGAAAPPAASGADQEHRSPGHRRDRCLPLRSHPRSIYR